MNKVRKFKNALQASECYSPMSIQARALLVQASIAAYLQDLPLRFFSYESLNVRKQKSYYQQATYKGELSTLPQPSATLVFQEINHLNAIITTRSTYDEPLEVCPRRT
jgi:hypothetical protein